MFAVQDLRARQSNNLQAAAPVIHTGRNAGVFQSCDNSKETARFQTRLSTTSGVIICNAPVQTGWLWGANLKATWSCCGASKLYPDNGRSYVE